jgi:hypothetical protein
MDRRMLLDLGLANGASASGVSSSCGRTFEPETTSHIVGGEMRRLEQAWAGGVSGLATSHNDIQVAPMYHFDLAGRWTMLRGQP